MTVEQRLGVIAWNSGNSGMNGLSSSANLSLARAVLSLSVSFLLSGFFPTLVRGFLNGSTSEGLFVRRESSEGLPMRLFPDGPTERL